MRTYIRGNHEPPIGSPEHSANQLARQLGGYIGRIVFVSTGTDFESAIAATAQAFPRDIRGLRVHGLVPATQLPAHHPEGPPGVAQMVAGLRETQSDYNFRSVVFTGTSDSTDRELTVAFHLTRAIRRSHESVISADRHGLIFVAAEAEALPEPYDLQDDRRACVLRLSGVGAEAAAPNLSLRFHQLYPQSI